MSRPLQVTALMVAAAACRPHATPELPLDRLRVTLASDATVGKLGGDKEPARRPWTGPIIEVLVEETPDGLVPLARERIAGVRMTPDALFERGRMNLRAAAAQPLEERTVQMAKARVQITRAADNHTAARLLLPELWSKISAESGGQLFAAAPARDILVWTTSTDENDQRALRGQARTAFQSRSYPISPAILRWTESGWRLEDPNPIVN